MPYKSVKELPDSTKNMPAHAKRIWMSAFNAASKQYDTEERAFAVAFAAVKKLYRQGEDGKWHKIKEAVTPQDMDAWLDSVLPDILAEAESLEDETVDLTEDDNGDGPGRALEHASELLACGTHVLSEDERGFLSSLIARLAKDTAAEEPHDPMDSYREQGPALIQEAYSWLVVTLESVEDDDQRAPITELIEVLKPDIPQDFDPSSVIAIATVPSYRVERAKEALEALKVWDLRMTEAGSRHATWEYELLDRIIEDLKRLRGMTPTEQKAMATEQANSPAAMMMTGYRESAEVDLQHIALHESSLITREAVGSNGREWEVVVIQAGLSKNNRLYPLEVLRRDAHLFEGCRVYAYDRVLKGKPIYDHLSDSELQANPQGYVKDLVGYLKNPRISGSRLIANLVILPSADWLRANLTHSFSEKPDVYGLSIDAEGDGHMVESGGREVLHVDAIRAVRSTDVVSFPAAGGGFLRLVAGVTPMAYEQEVNTLVEGLSQQLRTMHFRVALEDALDEAEVAGDVRRRLRARLMAAVPL